MRLVRKSLCNGLLNTVHELFNVVEKVSHLFELSIITSPVRKAVVWSVETICKDRPRIDLPFDLGDSHLVVHLTGDGHGHAEEDQGVKSKVLHNACAGFIVELVSNPFVLVHQHLVQYTTIEDAPLQEVKV